MRGKKYLSTILLETFGFVKTTMAAQNGEHEAGGKKLSQISVRFESAFYERLKRACEIQQHRAGQLVRVLVEWSLPYYETARSIEALSTMCPPPKRSKKKIRVKR